MPRSDAERLANVERIVDELRHVALWHDEKARTLGQGTPEGALHVAMASQHDLIGNVLADAVALEPGEADLDAPIPYRLAERPA